MCNRQEKNVALPLVMRRIIATGKGWCIDMQISQQTSITARASNGKGVLNYKKNRICVDILKIYQTMT